MNISSWIILGLIVVIAYFVSPWSKYKGQACVNLKDPRDPLGILTPTASNQEVENYLNNIGY